MPHILRNQSTDQLRNALTGGNFLGGGRGSFGPPLDIGPGLPLPQPGPIRRNLPYPTGGPPLPRTNLPFTPDMAPQTRNLPFPQIPGQRPPRDLPMPMPILPGRRPPPSQVEPIEPSRRRRPPPTARAKPAAPTRRRRVGATDVAGTAKRKPTTTRGKGRKTVVKGGPVRSTRKPPTPPTRKPPTPQQGAIKAGQAGRTARARRKSSL